MLQTQSNQRKPNMMRFNLARLLDAPLASMPK